MTKVFYTGAFEVITRNWKSKTLAGAQRILFDLLVISLSETMGSFLTFLDPPYLVEMLLGLLGKETCQGICSITPSRQRGYKRTGGS